VTVSLGEIRVSLEDLKSAGPGSILSLGKPFSAERDAELLVYGMRVARGKVCVLGEYMGIRILETGGAAFGGEGFRSTGNLLTDREREKVKDYDFLRPDKFTFTAIMRMAEIHSNFLRALALRVGTLAGHRVELTDQCTYGEFLSSIRREDFAYLHIRNEEWERGPGEQKPEEARIRVIEEPGTGHPFEAQTREALLKTVPANGKMSGKPVIFCHKKDLAGLDPVSVGACLRGAWRNIVDLNLKTVKSAERFEELPRINLDEMIILIKIAGAEGQEIFVVYPYPFLESLLGLLK
jgi:flagellar motor switch protein FliM